MQEAKIEKERQEALKLEEHLKKKQMQIKIDYELTQDKRDQVIINGVRWKHLKGTKQDPNFDKAAFQVRSSLYYHLLFQNNLSGADAELLKDMISKEKENRAAYLDEISKRQKIIDQLVQKRIQLEREEHKMPY